MDQNGALMPEVITTGMDVIARAEIDIQIATAHRYPRDIKAFRDEVTSMATLDQETAEGCFYSLRRQGKTIQGPSVRLAEIAVSAWGNIRAGGRVIGKSEDGRFIIGQGFCHDLQKNVAVTMEVQRRITTSDGRIYGDDMIGVTSNAAVAIAFRNSVFKVIPKALYKSAYEQAVKVATGGAKTLVERREKVFEKLRALNPMITDERILASLGKPSMENVTLDDVAHLIGLGTSIKDGHQAIDEAFPEQEKLTGEDIVGVEPDRKVPLKKLKKEAKPKTKKKPPEKAAEPEPDAEDQKLQEAFERDLAALVEDNRIDKPKATTALRKPGIIGQDQRWYEADHTCGVHVDGVTLKGMEAVISVFETAGLLHKK